MLLCIVAIFGDSHGALESSFDESSGWRGYRSLFEEIFEQENIARYSLGRHDSDVLDAQGLAAG